MISGITGCQKTDAYTRANEYKKQYKDDFAKAVENEFGQAYKLENVEGPVHSWASDYHIMTQYSARFMSYSGSLKITGINIMPDMILIHRHWKRIIFRMVS